MRLLILFLLLLSQQAFPHPGIAIVKDSRGTIYYSDLQQVWRISQGKQTIAVPGVHTHELYIDQHDNLYGAHEFNPTGSNTFYHYLWLLRPNGKLDTIVGIKEAYRHMDFSLARDVHGNEYYIKQFIKRPDTAHIYIRTTDGSERIFAKGAFKGVRWLHPQADGSLLFVQHNNIYRAHSNGTLTIVAQDIGNARPSFYFSGNSITVWGLWQDEAQNVYAAVFSDQAVKKITPAGQVSIYYQSSGNWAPTHGVFDNKGRLWLLESSDKNEVRVQMVSGPSPAVLHQRGFPFIPTLLGSLLTALTVFALWERKAKQRKAPVAAA